MTSIRNYSGDIRICRSCAQPCYRGDTEYGPMWQHFREQWDGVSCPNFPSAEASGQPFAIAWEGITLDTLKASYPDTSASAFPSRAKRP